MALILKDRVLETSQTSGTGTLTLAGPVIDFQSFSSAIGNGNTTYYTIADDADNQWEVGIGTIGAGTLTRDTVLSSSNSGNKVNFGSSIKNVFCDYPASKSVYQDANGLVTVPNLATNSASSLTPVLSYNATNSAQTNGATVAGSYLQNVMQNKSGTAGASTNFAVSNDLGTDSTYYGEFGMNSSVFSSGTPADYFSLNNGVYYSGHDGDISYGSGNGYKTFLAWGTTGDKAHVINASGAIGLNTNITGTTNFGTAGYILTSGGSSATPTWTNPTSIVGGAGGSNTQVQYNSSGALAGSANLTFNGTTLTTANDASISGLTVGKGSGSLNGNSVFGYQALPVATTGATFNTAIGHQAGYSITTGYQNALFGPYAGYYITTGISNTGVGYNSMATGATSTGSYNSALGWSSLNANTSGNNNVGIGYAALNFNTTASNNTAVGYQAGYANTTGAIDAFGYKALYANTTGIYNLALGTQALQSNTTGNNNIGAGNGALYTNTTGAGNIAVGVNSLVANTTGSSNVSLGYSALTANTTGSNNSVLGYQAASIGSAANGVVAVGVYALRNNTADQNTAVGYQAAYTNTSGFNFVAIGDRALFLNTSGSNNTATGYISLYNNTTGASNSAYGATALFTNSTGSNNTAVGQEALRLNTTASANTAVGYQAGYSNTTGTRVSAFGYLAGYSQATTGYSTFIGSYAGQLTTGSNNTFIGDVAGQYITIGANNTIIGRFNGNNGGLDIRGSNNYIVLSDGDGNPLVTTYNGGSVSLAGATPKAGTGITFPATQSASTDANTLDDYEEGTWTPSIAFDGNSVGVTYSANNAGSYTKIGNRVYITGYLILTNKGSSTGSATIGGLPFSTANLFSATSPAVLYPDAVTYTGMIVPVISRNSSVIEFSQLSVLGVQTPITNTNIANGTNIAIMACYSIS